MFRAMHVKLNSTLIIWAVGWVNVSSLVSASTVVSAWASSVLQSWFPGKSPACWWLGLAPPLLMDLRHNTLKAWCTPTELCR
ncbi:hypothetical protein AVEN_275141-1 [Araneus ventricosus]|uniref:Uncharacterized protein n=1 Tax=Araneus ventricosus TaxID=182803 RepID=A0A4Y2MF32_ARAVE|nr:hypothetical protein AVEN_275141-1 [Araneus ventricosus]